MTAALGSPLSPSTSGGRFQNGFQSRASGERCKAIAKRNLPFPARSSNGAYRDRTGDLRLAKPALSQLS